MKGIGLLDALILSAIELVQSFDGTLPCLSQVDIYSRPYVVQLRRGISLQGSSLRA